MTARDARAPVSVVIPTIGRPAQLRSCLESLARCTPRAAEIVVVDQSGGDEVAAVVARFEELGARAVRSHGRGVGLARNTGLREAVNDVVAMTDDDCTVAPTWIATAHRLATSDPARIFTGRVLAGGEEPAGHVPSTRTDEVAHDFTGQRSCDGLFSGNVVLPRRAALEMGGFDERLETAEDNDFGYRWLVSGRPMTFDPELVVWHHDWRSPAELERLYVVYWRGQGTFYGKHLRRGDPTMLRFLARDLKKAVKATGERIVRRRPRWTDWRRGIMRGLPAGLLRGFLGRGPR
jgi:glycosyltransferase involved in cell wall biosynthesis